MCNCGGIQYSRSYGVNGKPKDTCAACGADVTVEIERLEAKRQEQRAQNFAGASR